MPGGWGLAQYTPRADKPNALVCAITNWQDTIFGDGGTYNYEQILGNYAVFVVKGVTAATLQAIVADPVIRRFPGVQFLNDSLSVLTNPQWAGYRQFALDLGYSATEWDTRFGGAGQQGNYVLRDIIAFVCQRRFGGRFDVPTQKVVLDGPVFTPATPDTIDAGA